MTNLAETNPLHQPIQHNGQVYFTSHYFHQQYQANSEGDVKYKKLTDFNRLIRNIETYDNYVDRADIVELVWDDVKDSRAQDLRPCFESRGYNPLMLINATAQVALTHHLDDAISKQVSIAVNEKVAKKPKPLATLNQAMSAMKMVAKDLRYSETSKSQAYNSIFDQYGVQIDALPHYVIDDGSIVTGEGSARPTLALKTLLKENGVEISAIKFNVILEGMGFLETLERQSRKNPETMKKFKSVTEAGEKFGQNLKSPTNPRETQPHWYMDSFGELLEMAMLFLQEGEHE